MLYTCSSYTPAAISYRLCTYHMVQSVWCMQVLTCLIWYTPVYPVWLFFLQRVMLFVKYWNLSYTGIDVYKVLNNKKCEILKMVLGIRCVHVCLVYGVYPISLHLLYYVMNILLYRKTTYYSPVAHLVLFACVHNTSTFPECHTYVYVTTTNQQTYKVNSA